MVAYLSKSDASEGFNQIINFPNRSSIKYALTVNPNIYVSCIKQFWTTITVKQVNDVTRLQALVDKKKVVITEATIKDALHLDDAEGVDCLPNEEIFAEFARMGYEKPSTKLTFYKPFFLSQWNFVRNVDSTTKFYMYPRFLQLIIRKQVRDLSTHTTKYTSPALTQKVFPHMKRVGKGVFRVETPLFVGMLVEQEIDAKGDADEHVEEVNTGDAAEGDDSAAHGEVPTVAEEQSIPSPTPPSLPPQPPQDIPSTSQVKKLEKRNKVRVLKLIRLQKIGTSQRVETSDGTIMDDESNQGRMIAKMDQDDVVVLKDDKEENKEEDETKLAEVQEVVDVVSTAKLITEIVTAASETITAASAIITAAEVQVPTATTATLTAAPARAAAAPSRRRKGVIIRDPEEESATSTIIPAKTKSKDKGKGILVEEPKPLKKKQQIEQDEQYARDWITPIFEAKFNSNVVFLLKTKEQMEEEENIALQTINETPAKKVAKRRKLNEEVEELKRHLQIVPNEDDDVYTKATPLERCTCLNLEESKNFTWSSKGQELEAIGIMWCANHNLYNHIADFVSEKETYVTGVSSEVTAV
uniref:Xylulose kinase-1 n=1 Tax=Tanacetum cinerariifolium TaxID=118510 RepID=A0A6L2JGH5_TANCI|nr:xylulose kinase-1 [Tanacetum cinerariifolium]